MSTGGFSHYQIVRKLGQGGMGEVFLAEDTSLDRNVALKFLPAELEQDTMARKRLLREAKAAAALDHPYICHIHEVSEVGGKPFIAMEYVEGQTLRDRISQGPLPLNEALQAAVEIAEALQNAHERGVIHRDLKPANVMITASGHIKVMDFGLAKQLIRSEAAGSRDDTLSGLTVQGATVGTLAYMSPEQVCGRTADARSDIFSFGITLFELVSGVHPFRKESGLETAGAIVSEDPPALSARVPGVPEGLERAVGKMLAKKPDERYRSMTDVRADLHQVLREHESGAVSAIHAGRAGLRRRARRWMAAAALIVLAGAAAWYVQQRWFKSPAAALAFQERDWILITDFENQTGEDVFSGSLETAMTVSLQQSRYVNVFPRARLPEVLKRMRREGATGLDETLGREVALREGIKGLLVCSISRVGTEYLLAARLVDPGTMMAVYSQSSQAGGPDKVLGALDDLAGKVRQELGESLANISKTRMPLLQATTFSLEALKAFTDARRVGGETGVQLLKRALELDPDFALAHADLGFQCYISNNRPLGEEHFKKALSLLERLTLREQLWIRALVEDWRGNRDQGIASYQVYLQQYPDDPSAWFRLGYACLITNRDAPAVEAFKKVIEINPSDSAAHINLATCYKSMQKNEEAIETYETAFQLNPDAITGQFVNNEYGFLLVRTGQIEKAADTFRKMASADDASKKPRGHRSLGLLYAYQGKYSAAIKEFSEAILLNKAGGAKLSEMRDRQFLASAMETKGLTGGFEKEMAAIRRIQKEIRVEPSFLYFTGRAFARTGRTPEAVRILAELESRLGDTLASSAVNRSNTRDQAYFNLLRAEVSLAQNRPQQALEYGEMARSLEQEIAREPLAYLRLKSGDVDEAIEKYRLFLATDVLGHEIQEPWILAHYQLGRLLEQKGEPARAAEYYEKFVNLWRDGDEDLAPLRDARLRLAALKKAAGK